MTLRGFVHTLCLPSAETNLQRVVAIRRCLLFLHHDARAGFNDRDRDHFALGALELHHADFSADESCHIHIPIRATYELKVCRVSLQLDLNIDPGRNIEFAQRVNGLLRWLKNVEKPFVRTDFVLIPRLFIDMRRAVDGEPFNPRRQRNRTRYPTTGAPHRLDNLPHRLIQHAVVVGF